MRSMMLLATVSLWMISAAAAAIPNQPEIVFAHVDYDDPAFPDGLLFVFGVEFGTSPPTVTLSETVLPVLTSTDTSITARMPPSLSPGTYGLVVTNAHPSGKSDEFDVTIGTQGPEGPQGSTGATGDQGPQGPPGNLVLAGQSCPADRFVTGFDAIGNFVCSCLDFDEDGFSPDGGACGPLDCSDQNPLISPGAQESCFDGIDNNCDGQIDEGCPEVAEVDIVFVIDNSASMGEENNSVEQNINGFAQALGAAGLDYRIIMLAEHGPGSTDICVGPPLSGTALCGSTPVNTERFFHYSTNVQSHNSLCKILGTFAGGDVDEFGLFPSGWQALLRPDAKTAFIEISDDGTSCNFFGVPFNDGNNSAGGQIVASDFDSELLDLSPLHFGTQADRNYLFYSIIGLKELASGPATPYGPTFPVEVEQCPTGVDPGTGYQWLSKNTGALRFPLCGTSVYGAIFQEIAADLSQQLLQ